MHNQRLSSLATFLQPRRTIAAGHPDAPAFPTGARIVDAAVQTLAVETQGIGHPQGDEFAVDEGMHTIEQLAGDYRYIFTQTGEFD